MMDYDDQGFAQMAHSNPAMHDSRGIMCTVCQRRPSARKTQAVGVELEKLIARCTCIE